MMNSHIAERFSKSRNRNATNSAEEPARIRQRGNPKIWSYHQEARAISETTGTWLSRPEIPTSDEVLDNPEPWEPRDVEGNVLLECNKIRGAWNSTEDYLRTHYGLFREEAVRPLREAVNWMKDNPGYQEDGLKSHSIGVYDHVRVKALTFSNKGLGVRVSFSLTRVGKNIRWEQSKRLISGSLVALTPTNDMFKSKCIVAVVAARPLDGVRLNPPELDLFFAQPKDLNLDPDIEWFMVEERSSFFEAQRHTLIALQKMTREAFPLSEHLVDVQQKVPPPNYIRENPIMDLSKIFRSSPDARGYEYERTDLRRFPMNPPTTLDESQLESLKRILTKRLALVQGPPGTGKTHVSVMALRALLANQKFEDPPIIIACQTNHALDQILRLIAKHEPAFARLGGRSQDQGVIKQRTLFALRQADRGRGFAGQQRRSNRLRLDDLRKKMCLLISPLANVHTTEPQSIHKGLLDHELLCKLGVLTQAQCNSLERGDSQWANHADQADDDLPLRKWLGQQLLTINRTGQREDLGFEYEEADLEFEQLQELEAEAVTPDDDDEWDRLKGETVKLLDNAGGRNGASMTDAQIQTLLSQQDMWKIRPQQRGAVFEYLRRQVKELIMAKLRELAGDYYTTCTEYRFSGWEDDYALLRTQKVIGMTTTGLSKYRPLISSLDPKIVLIEEAAETLEAPVTAACIPTVQHLILVGDHKQLRPQCAVKELECDAYSLNVSLFERLVINNVEFSILQRQRRMVPEIRRVLQPIYGDAITDHPCVEDLQIRPPVPGMGGVNSYFFTHEWPEIKDEQASVMNEREAQMIVEFFSYLVYNGMTTEQITVLTFYNGQRKLILKKLRSHVNLKSPRTPFKVVTVDSYQGEENDVVLLSLVRNNPQRAIGFLNVDNRVCVALSRAKCGFYLFGNAELLLTESDTWSNVVQIMSGKRKPFYPKGTRKHRLGFNLPLTCARHNQLTLVDDPEELGKLHGGCDLKCQGILPCGHRCPLFCHPYDHDQVNCGHNCNRILDCGHTCAGMCGDPCQCSVHGCGDNQDYDDCRQDPPRAFRPPSRQNRLSRSGSCSNAQAWQDYANGGHRQHDAMLVQKAKDAVEFETRLAMLKVQSRADVVDRSNARTPSPPDTIGCVSPLAEQMTPSTTMSTPKHLGHGRYKWTSQYGPDETVMWPQLPKTTASPTPQKSGTSGARALRIMNIPVKRSPAKHPARNSSGQSTEAWTPPHMRTKSQDNQTTAHQLKSVAPSQQSNVAKVKNDRWLIDFD